MAAALRTAEASDGVLSRQHLRHVGLSRWDVRREVRAGRWRLVGRQCVVTYTGALTTRARWRVALLEIGAHSALDGVTALIAAGLQHFDCSEIHLSIPRGARPGTMAGVRVHETRRRRDADVRTTGIRRVRPEIAAVRAALWATSDRQAALLIVMTVQQRIATGPAIAVALRQVRKDRRRALLNAVVRDVTDGAQGLGELDFAALCRTYGIPAPNRQVVRHGLRGRVYLDAYWDDCDLVVEIEGIHHGSGLTQVEDALRQNSLTVAGASWLRIPLLGLRIAPDQFMAQVVAARHRRLAAA